MIYVPPPRGVSLCRLWRKYVLFECRAFRQIFYFIISIFYLHIKGNKSNYTPHPEVWKLKMKVTQIGNLYFVYQFMPRPTEKQRGDLNSCMQSGPFGHTQTGIYLNLIFITEFLVCHWFSWPKFLFSFTFKLSGSWIWKQTLSLRSVILSNIL